MRRTQLILAPAALTLAICLPAQTLVDLPPVPPRPAAPAAPDFVLPDSAGKEHALSAYKGKIVVLEWTNHLCPFVAKHYVSGNMQALQKRSTERGVIWLTIISSAPGLQGHVTPAEAARLTHERSAAPTAVLLDPQGTVGRLFKAKATPHMFVIDREGTLVYSGAIDSDSNVNAAERDPNTVKNYVAAALAALTEGKAVETTETKPYGCSVKYAKKHGQPHKKDKDVKGQTLGRFGTDAREPAELLDQLIQTFRIGAAHRLLSPNHGFVFTAYYTRLGRSVNRSALPVGAAEGY